MTFYAGRVRHSNKAELEAWREKIAWLGKGAGLRPQDGPVALTLAFSMPRGKTVTRPFATVAPDLDKLCRAVLDALTGVAYLDDCQVTDLRAVKGYGDPCVEITVKYSQG